MIGCPRLASSSFAIVFPDASDILMTPLPSPDKRMTVFSMDDEQMLSTAQDVLGRRLSKDGLAYGAHKSVLLCHDPHGHYAVHFVDRKDLALVKSGIAIRQHMAHVGCLFPAHLGFEEHAFPFLVIAEGRLPGRDLEHCLDQVDEERAIKIAQTVANTVQTSASLFQPKDARIGHHLLGQSPSTKDMKTFFLDGLSMAAQGLLAKNDTALLPGLRQLFLRAPERIDFDAPSQTFIWDVLERNIMIDEGELTGFVDQDGLLTGDIIQVPAWASVYLDMKGFSFTQQYVRAWMDRWSASETQWERFRWYRASYGLFQEARSGQREASGRIKQGVCRKQLASWMDEALQAK
jgi:hypothetical protein